MKKQTKKNGITVPFCYYHHFHSSSIYVNFKPCVNERKERG